MRQLLIGAGNSRVKKMVHELTPGKEFDELVTMDIDPNCGADVIHNLDHLPYEFFEDGYFDEIHAYEVLEHCGTQGDENFFFEQFNEFHRILKPGGVFCASVPNYKSVWAFGDPGHKRVLPPTVFNFLAEAFYDQLGKTACADYRHLIKGYWNLIGIDEGEQVFFLLQK
jgi:SAM-dependent methyltransferase